MSWVDPLRKLRVRANADIPRDAKQARAVRRRRHRPVPHRAHVLCRRPHRAHAHHDSGQQREGPPRCAEEAAADAERRLCWLFKAMESLPVTIRLLDPPLHEFLPQREDLLVEIAAPRRHQAPLAQAEGTAHAAGPRGRTARGEPHARTAWMPPRHHVPRDHRDAGARHLRGRGRGEERRAAIRTSKS